MTDTTQPVAETTEAVAQPTAEATGARDNDLESILKEFETETKPTQPQPEPQKVAAQPAQPDPAVRSLLLRQEKRDLDDAVKEIKGKHEHVSPRLVKGWLNAAAEENPKLKEIFDGRFENPNRWEKAVKALAAEFDKEQARLPDKEATEDREALTAAVKGASKTVPDPKPKNYGAMTSSDGRKAVKDEFGFDPGW